MVVLGEVDSTTQKSVRSCEVMSNVSINSRPESSG